ncbi:MAG TPA: hypothetical protein VFI31_09325 [Pirellulales bacterium]|nr:hypothetical protein [Pirellulales bacterium]
MPASSNYEPALRHRARALDVWLIVTATWYLTGLLAGGGFCFGFYLVRPAPGIIPEHREFLDAVNWMDGKWYKQIATEGYDYDPKARSNVAFFPVYPLLSRAVMAVTGLPAETALLIVSNVSFLAALGVLALYVRGRAPAAGAAGSVASVRDACHREAATDQSILRGATCGPADCVLLAATIFPIGCFFRLAYSESTFLFLSVLAMFAMQRHWSPWFIALLVGLGTATRPVGVALVAPFAIYLFRTACISSFVYLPFACWGLLTFMAYQRYAFGDALAVFKAHSRWHIRADVPFAEKAAALATLEPIRSVYDSGSPAFWASFDAHGIPWFSLQFANPLFFLGSVGLIAIGAWPRRSPSLCGKPDEERPVSRASWLSLEEISFSALVLLIPYCTRGYEMGMGSMGRFTAVAFPIYLVMGALLRRLPPSLLAGIAALSGFLLAAYTALYAARYVVF